MNFQLWFEPDELLPAACQGILAVQARQDFDLNLLAGFHDPDTVKIAQAERSFVKTLDGGCSSPVAAYGRLKGEQLYLTGLYADEASGEFEIGSFEAPAVESEELGRRLALELKGRAQHV